MKILGRSSAIGPQVVTTFGVMIQTLPGNGTMMPRAIRTRAGTLISFPKPDVPIFMHP